MHNNFDNLASIIGLINLLKFGLSALAFQSQHNALLGVFVYGHTYIVLWLAHIL